MTEKLNDSTTQPVQHKPAQGRNVNTNIDITKMDSKERSDNWDAVLANYGVENIRKK